METESITSKEESWSLKIEAICEDVLTNIKLLSEIHKTNYLVLKIYLFRLKIPVIVLSAFNSIVSVGLSNYTTQSITSTITCLLSLCVGLLGSLELFIGVSTKMDIEYSTYKSLKVLGIKISHTLKLEPCNRDMNGDIFLKEVISEYESIFKNSLINVMDINDDLLKMPIKSPLTPRGVL